MSAELYIVRLVLDRRALARVATQHRLPQNLDDGYLLHAGLSQLFATSTDRAEVPLSSFAVDDTHVEAAHRTDLLYVLGYAHEPSTVLEAKMGERRGEILKFCDSRAVPEFQVGQRFGFRTRVCPIVRTRTPGDRALGVNAKGKVKTREIDAFVHATLGVPREQEVSREAVYVGWAQKQLSAEGACALDGARLASFRREVMRRRGGDRIERPNAVLEGQLTVNDPTKFRALVARGLGRHRSFGFGMMLLRPPA